MSGDRRGGQMRQPIGGGCRIAGACVAALVASLVLAGTSTGAPIASSKFTNGSERWRVVGDAGGGRDEPDHHSHGGNAGGYVSIDDAVTGGVMYWRAPQDFRRHAEDAFKGQLRYSLRQSASTNQFGGYADLILEGDGKRLEWVNGPFPIYPSLAPTWGSYAVGLKGGDPWGWVNVTADPTDATNAEMKAVLKDLDALLIRAEFEDGPDTDDLDTVALKRAAAIPP